MASCTGTGKCYAHHGDELLLEACVSEPTMCGLARTPSGGGRIARTERSGPRRNYVDIVCRTVSSPIQRRGKRGGPGSADD